MRYCTVCIILQSYAFSPNPPIASAFANYNEKPLDIRLVPYARSFMCLNAMTDEGTCLGMSSNA